MRTATIVFALTLAPVAAAAQTTTITITNSACTNPPPPGDVTAPVTPSIAAGSAAARNRNFALARANFLPLAEKGDADAQRYAQTLAIAAKDPDIDGLLVILTPQAMSDPTATAQQLDQAEQDYRVLERQILAQSTEAEVLNRRIQELTTRLDEQGRLLTTGDRFTLLADMLFKAIGQTFVASPLGELLEVKGGRIAINADRQTSLANVWAGGDCVPGDDLTVSAVQDGKIAAEAIDRALRA